MSDRSVDFRHLSIVERLQLVEDIWDSIAVDTPSAVPLSGVQCAELDRRLRDHDEGKDAAIPWEQVRADLFGGTPRGG